MLWLQRAAQLLNGLRIWISDKIMEDSGYHLTYSVTSTSMTNFIMINVSAWPQSLRRHGATASELLDPGSGALTRCLPILMFKTRGFNIDPLLLRVLGSLGIYTYTQ